MPYPRRQRSSWTRIKSSEKSRRVNCANVSASIGTHIRTAQPCECSCDLFLRIHCVAMRNTTTRGIYWDNEKTLLYVSYEFEQHHVAPNTVRHKNFYQLSFNVIIHFSRFSQKDKLVWRACQLSQGLLYTPAPGCQPSKTLRRPEIWG